MKKYAFLVLAAALAYVFYARYQDKRVEGFYVERIAPIFPDDPRWDIAVTQEQIDFAKSLLNQPYNYLGHGFQCYAFVSQDDKYVLKFIRQQRLQPNILMRWVPSKVAAGKKRADYLFRSLKVAFEDVPEETGLIFVHLNKTANTFPVITLHDKVGTPYQVALDDHEFVLQKKALPIKPTLAQLMKEGKVDEAKVRVDQIFTLLETCAKKGIADMDNQLIRKNNLGFLPDRCIYIDIGKITRKASMKNRERFSRDLERLKPLYEWLNENYPELASHFIETQERVLANF
ncbi:MAG: hypothetical protein JSR37_05360 [Verrucomicrobia bacterium]|nr:hypothetical protein [Verrucomicrobiota bacterium]MBS0638153.1 hypothetical protein [Verrucomicrobiota bacterium]